MKDFVHIAWDTSSLYEASAANNVTRGALGGYDMHKLAILAVATAWACSNAEDVENNDPMVCAGLPFAPCGGDVSGDWTLEEHCPAMDVATALYPEVPECSEATIGNLESPQFVISFSENGTYHLQLGEVSSLQYRIDRACVEAVNPETSLEDHCVSAGESLAQAPGISGVACATLGDLCTCDYLWDSRTSDVGTFTVSGTQLTMTSDSGAFVPQAYDYCVTEDVLVLDMSVPGEQKQLTAMSRF